MRPERTAVDKPQAKDDFVRLPVVIEQEIGTLVLDRNGKRSIVGAGLVVLADFVNEMTAARATTTLPIRCSFPNGEGGRFRVTIDAEHVEEA